MAVAVNDNQITAVSAGIAAGITGLVVYLFYAEPWVYVRLVTEDSWGEYATFVFYTVAFFLMMGGMSVDRTKLKPGFLLITFCFFFMAMEEISWGQRIIGIPTPELFQALNRQGEINLHNFARVNRPMRFLALIILFWAMGLPLVMNRYEKIRHLVTRLGTPMATKPMWPFFIIACGFILTKPLIRGVEIGEVLLGLAFCGYAIHFFRTVAGENRCFKVSMIWHILVIGIIVTGFTGFLVTRWPNPYALRLRYSDFVAEAYPNRGMTSQAKVMLTDMLIHTTYMTVEFLEALDGYLADLQASDTGRGNRPGPDALRQILVNRFLSEPSVSFNVYSRRKVYNTRPSDLYEQRARLLISIGNRYLLLGDRQAAGACFLQASACGADPELILRSDS